MPRILFIDNDAEFTGVFQRRFIASGFEFEVATSLKEALQKISDGAFDITLLEIAIQGEEDGLEILKALRTNPLCDPDSRIIVFSDSTDRDIHKQALDLRVNGFLTKLDYHPQRLVGEINRFLHQFSEQRKNRERLKNGGVPIPKNKKILLVEDEDVFIDMFGKRLRFEGYEVDVAMNGIMGFEKAIATKYDLVITDMVMSGLNGKELIDKLKADERTKDTPVFLFSASVGEDVLNQIRCEGTKCFMKTHLLPSELALEVNKFLD
jgi:CheY-like chemotaxis protein